MNIKEVLKNKINVTYLAFIIIIAIILTGYIITSESKFVLEKELNFDLEIVESDEWNKRTLITGTEFNEKIISSGATQIIFGVKEDYTKEIENIKGIDLAVEDNEKAFKTSDIELYTVTNADNEKVALVLSDYKIKANKDSSKMFYNIETLTSVKFLNFETSNVENMSSMFYGCKNITEVNLNKFDTSKVSDISNMFYECNLLKTVYVSDLWNLDKITTEQENVFYNCEKIVGGNGTTFDMAKITSEFACIDKEEKAGYFTYKNEDEVETVKLEIENKNNNNNSKKQNTENNTINKNNEVQNTVVNEQVGNEVVNEVEENTTNESNENKEEVVITENNTSSGIESVNNNITNENNTSNTNIIENSVANE